MWQPFPVAQFHKKPLPVENLDATIPAKAMKTNIFTGQPHRPYSESAVPVP